MNMKKIKIFGFLLGCFFLANNAYAQDSANLPVDMNFQIKNMHLWRGIQVTNELMSDVDVHFMDKNKVWKVGVWGGAGVNGVYKEFDYYVSFAKNGFSAAVWDIYNFSKGATYNNTDIFNYSARGTGRFIDASIGYRFQGSFPLSINWATVVFGRDRGSENKQNLYSSYVSLSYPLLRNKVVDVDLGLGGAFALNPESGTSANFYGDKAGITDISLTATRKVQLGSFTLPVSVTTALNPVRKEGNIQVAFNLF